LKKRSEGVFKENVVEDGVIAKCAAFAAREHGDARRALDLLRVAGELAEREGSNRVFLKHIDTANGKIERDKILDVVKSEPKQFQLVLYSIIQLSQKGNNPQTKLNPSNKNSSNDSIFTGEIYNHYNDLCSKYKMEILTQRRVSDIIQEFDMLGIINVKVISKGRGGRMREIKLAITKNIIEKVKEIIEDSFNYN